MKNTRESARTADMYPDVVELDLDYLHCVTAGLQINTGPSVILLRVMALRQQKDSAD